MGGEEMNKTNRSEQIVKWLYPNKSPEVTLLDKIQLGVASGVVYFGVSMFLMTIITYEWAKQVEQERKMEALEHLFSKTKRSQENVLSLFQEAWQGSKSEQRLGLIEETMTEEWQKRKKQMYTIDDQVKEARRQYQQAKFASKGAGTHATD